MWTWDNKERDPIRKGRGRKKEITSPKERKMTLWGHVQRERHGKWWWWRLSRLRLWKTRKIFFSKRVFATLLSSFLSCSLFLFSITPSSQKGSLSLPSRKWKRVRVGGQKEEERLEIWNASSLSSLLSLWHCTAPTASKLSYSLSRELIYILMSQLSFLFILSLSFPWCSFSYQERILYANRNHSFCSPAFSLSDSTLYLSLSLLLFTSVRMNERRGLWCIRKVSLAFLGSLSHEPKLNYIHNVILLLLSETSNYSIISFTSLILFLFYMTFVTSLSVSIRVEQNVSLARFCFQF